MDISVVMQDIKNKSPKKFYIFAGDEIAIRDIYINKIADCIGVTPTRADSIASIMTRLSGKSFINSAQCYVVSDDTDFMKADDVWQDFIDAKIQNDNIVILCVNSLDKRSKFYKTINNSIVIFEHLKDDILKKYIAKNITLSDKNMNKLIEVCESDYSSILLEIDKVSSYSNNTGKSYDEAFKHLIEDGTIHQPPKDAIFDFVDAILKNKIKLAYDLLQQCYAIGESNMVLLSVLYTSAKQVLQVQSYRGDELSKSTGLTGFQIKKAKEKCGYYSNGDLIHIMELVRCAEKGIKTGLIDDDMSVEYVLVNI